VFLLKNGQPIVDAVYLRFFGSFADATSCVFDGSSGCLAHEVQNYSSRDRYGPAPVASAGPYAVEPIWSRTHPLP
jgi:hypothetical protein